MLNLNFSLNMVLRLEILIQKKKRKHLCKYKRTVVRLIGCLNLELGGI
jgi:hypothetical protein